MNDSNEDASIQPQRKPGTGTVTRAKPRCFFFSIVPLLNLARKSYSNRDLLLRVEINLQLAAETCASGPGLDKDSNAGETDFFVWQRLFFL